MNSHPCDHFKFLFYYNLRICSKQQFFFRLKEMLIEFKKLTNINDLDPYIIEIQKVVERRIPADVFFQCGIHSLVLSKVMELKPKVTTIIEKEKEQRELEEELNKMVLEQENQKKKKKEKEDNYLNLSNYNVLNSPQKEKLIDIQANSSISNSINEATSTPEVTNVFLPFQGNNDEEVSISHIEKTTISENEIKRRYLFVGTNINYMRSVIMKLIQTLLSKYKNCIKKNRGYYSFISSINGISIINLNNLISLLFNSLVLLNRFSHFDRNKLTELLNTKIFKIDHVIEHATDQDLKIMLTDESVDMIKNLLNPNEYQMILYLQFKEISMEQFYASFNRNK